MIILKLSRKERIQHILIWLFILSYIFTTAPKTNYLFMQFIGCLFSVLNFSLFYYFILCILLPNIWKNKKILTALSLAVLFIFYFCLKWSIGNFQIYFAHANSPPGRFQRYLSVSGLFFTLIAFIAFSAYFNRMALDKLRRESTRGKAILYQELDFLKRQFNSHLTFNFLNFVYGKVLQTSERASEAIGLFSGVLRYSLGSKSGEGVSLQAELENISNFVELQRCLFMDLHVEFNQSGDTIGLKILPRILLSFVESAFKFGILNDPWAPIIISAMYTPAEIHFEIKYKVNAARRIQLSNETQKAKKYLELFYAENHTLRINDETEFHSVKLHLKPLP